MKYCNNYNACLHRAVIMLLIGEDQETALRKAMMSWPCANCSTSGGWTPPFNAGTKLKISGKALLRSVGVPQICVVPLPNTVLE